jgi:hypothetical protein
MPLRIRPAAFRIHCAELQACILEKRGQLPVEDLPTVESVVFQVVRDRQPTGIKPLRGLEWPFGSWLRRLAPAFAGLSCMEVWRD